MDFRMPQTLELSIFLRKNNNNNKPDLPGDGFPWGILMVLVLSLREDHETYKIPWEIL